MFRPEEEWAPGALMGPNYECGDKRYRIYEDGAPYRRLAILGHQELDAYELLDYKSGDALPLILRFNTGLPRLIMEQAKDIALRYSRMLGDRASGRAAEATAHFFHDEVQSKLVVVWPDIFVEQPWAALPIIGSYLSKPLDDTSNDPPGENRAPWPIQPANTGRYHIPGTGSLRYLCSCRPDARPFQVPFEQLVPLLRPTVGDGRRPGEYRDRPLIKPGNNFNSGVPMSNNFKGVARRLKADEIAGGDARRGIRGQRDNVSSEREHALYLKELRESMEGVIDMADSSVVWAPNERGAIYNKVLDALEYDTGKGNHPMRFTTARALLNQMFARQPPPGQKVWIKVPKRDHEAAGAALLETTVQQLLKNPGFVMRMEAPQDEQLRFATLHGQVPIDKDGRFDFMTWYVTFGMREVHGPRFWPLGIHESLADSRHRDHINTFCGFACHAWIKHEYARQESEREYRAQDADPDSNLWFYLHHLRHICSDDQDTFVMRTRWHALRAFWPELKAPTCFIDKGPPGCGKTSASVAFGECMLNKQHMRKVTDMFHLVGHFNADVESCVYTVIEEMDFKDQKRGALNALQGMCFRHILSFAVATPDPIPL